MVEITITCKVAPMGSSLFIAATHLGGQLIRGRSAKDEATALRNLFYALQDENNDDVAIAVTLAAQGESLESLFASAGELSSGSEATTAE